MIRVGSVEEFINTSYIKNQVYIIGAGKDGKIAADKLNGITNIKGYIDADKNKEGREYLDIKCFYIDDILNADYDFSESVAVICIGSLAYLSDKELYKKAFFLKLKQIGFKEIVMVDRTISVMDVLSKNMIANGEEADDNILKLKWLRLPNYLTMEDNIRRSFLDEACDLILPGIYNDWSVINEGPYEDSDFLLGSGGVILDCGANLGIFSAYAAAKGNKVYAFEPIPKSLEYLNEVKNLYDSLEIVPLALSDKAGKVTMSCNDNLGQNRIVSKKSDRTTDVFSTTVDDFVIENNLKSVDFIKADIEGAERYMLRGAANTLKKFAPKLSICEYHLDDDPEVLETLIKQMNPDYIIEHKYKKIYAYVER